LENKIVLKAKRIKKSQEKVLGNLDELKNDDDDDFKEHIVVKRIPKIKKKVIIYNNDTTDTDDADYEEVVKKPRKRVSKMPVPESEPIPKPPTIHRVVQFV